MATPIQRLGGRFGLVFKIKQLQRQSISKDVFQKIIQSRNVHSYSPLLATTRLDLPALSPTMESGNIIKWMKKEGDIISPGDVLCEIETDKAVVSFDTEEEGILAKILVPENSNNVPVGKLIALMVEEGEDWQNVEVPADTSAAAPAAPSPAASPPPPMAAAAAVAAPAGQASHLMAPSVKKLLTEYNIQASSVPATGPSHSLLKGDVLSYVKSQNLQKVDQMASAPAAAAAPAAPALAAPTSAPGANYVDIPLTNMRRVIAKRLTESKSTIPHAYAAIESNMGEITALRAQLKADGIKVSVNDFIIKASALALQRNPRVNAIWAGNGAQLSPTVDISVAVATPNGLITPIVKGASYLSVDQISETVKELAGRAKIGKLQPQEYQGGSFSISNLGMFGISEFTAVINPPQLAIMAVGGSRSVAQEDGEGTRMTVTLSYDSRALDPLDATRFLEEFRAAMENPQCMLSGTGLDSKAEAFAF